MLVFAKSFRSTVFAFAHNYYNKNKVYGTTFSEALKIAWRVYRTYNAPAKDRVTATPERIEKIARNINAFDTDYKGEGDRWTTKKVGNDYYFWDNLKNKLEAILKTLDNASRIAVASLCNETEAKYFHLVA